VKQILIIALLSFATASAAQTTRSNCYLLWDQIHCDRIQLEPKPPIGHPTATGSAECRDGQGKLTACPATAPKPATPGAKPT
jgi:hypothetical protein